MNNIVVPFITLLLGEVIPPATATATAAAAVRTVFLIPVRI